MKPDALSRAQAAASSLARELGLSVDSTAVVHNSNKISLRLLPCDVFARVAPTGQEVAALEVEIARDLRAMGNPVAALEPRVEPRTYERGGFTITFWTYCERATADRISARDYAQALQRLHAGMRAVRTVTPHFTDRVAEAEHLVADSQQTPHLVDEDRTLLSTTLRSARHVVVNSTAPEQLLHGEPHPGNVLNTSYGPLFIDLETCCRGPIEFDLAHVPDEVCAHYAGIDQQLLHECRRLVLAMVAAWRSDVRDEYPNGREAGRDILATLRRGPPWPPLEVAGVAPFARER